MRILAVLMTIFVSMISTGISAAGVQCSTSFPSPSGCGEIEVDVHALYWKAMQCYTIFAHQQTEPEPSFFLQDVVPISPDYEWGVEARVRYRRACYSAEISYVWYENRAARVLRSDTPNLFPAGLTLPGSTAVGGFLSQEYQKLDGRLAREWWGACGFNYKLFINGRWLQLDRLLDTESLSSPLPAFNRTSESFHGGAFGFGVGCEWACCNWIRLFGEINPMLAIGRRKDFERILQNGVRLERVVRPEVAVLPAVDARAGASLTYDVGCISVGIDFGWSVNYYWNVFPQNIPATPIIRRVLNCDSIGFSGPFFGIVLGY